MSRRERVTRTRPHILVRGPSVLRPDRAAPEAEQIEKIPGRPAASGVARVREWVMPLSAHPLRTSVAVSDLQQAIAFYEGKLGLPVLQSGPSAHIVDGSRVYGSAGGPALNVYQSVTAGKTPATLATWYVDDIDTIVTELVSSGVEFTRYDQFDHDVKGITARAGGGRIAWFQDPDGNTFAIEADN